MKFLQPKCSAFTCAKLVQTESQVTSDVTQGWTGWLDDEMLTKGPGDFTSHKRMEKKKKKIMIFFFLNIERK